jgi:hypothetical protein
MSSEGGEKLDKKRHLFDIKLNSITDSNNPTRKDCEFILHDFEVSHNKAFISKETAHKTLHTLKDMPIVAKYYSVSEAGAKDDALGSHEVYIDEDRDTGDLMVGLNTVPIGVFNEDAYITTITDENGNQKEVVAGKGILWASRFPNVIGLLKEWVDSGVDVVSSMEILYDSYAVKDGIEEILSYVYEGHCLLNSESRGNHSKVYPAYDVSKLTKLVAQAIDQDASKEGETVEDEKVIQEVSEVVEETNVEDVTVEETIEESVEEVVEQSQEEVVEENDQLTQLQNQINELTEKVTSLTTENDSLLTKLNEATDKLVQLNSVVEELKPFKEQVDQENFEKALNEKKEFYAKKFTALKAAEKFDSAEVQELVKKAVYENEDGKQAVLQLNSMLVELVEVSVESNTEDAVIREVANKREKLIPVDIDFESRYSL